MTPARWKCVPARDGSECLVVRAPDGAEIPVYSRVHPRRSAEDAVRRAELEGCDSLLLLGVGLGYHLEAMERVWDI